MFEVMEYTLEHQLPNFSECWWDHVSALKLFNSFSLSRIRIIGVQVCSVPIVLYAVGLMKQCTFDKIKNVLIIAPSKILFILSVDLTEPK